MKFLDEDDGTTEMDVVKVPEGFSFQVGFRDGYNPSTDIDYISVIVSPERIQDLIEHLQIAL